MIYKLNTGMVQIFSGTYETSWSTITDTHADGSEIEAWYNQNELMKSIAEAYAENVDMIKDELSIPWVKMIKFTGGVYSPREYNFSTDSLDFEIDIDYRAMVKYLKSLEHNVEYAQYLRDNYSSRDGFWSWTPDTWSETLEAITKHGDHEDQAVSALIRWAGGQTSEHNFEYMGRIEGEIYEQWSCNGYGGLDYWFECPECDEHMEYNHELGGMECPKHPVKK